MLSSCAQDPAGSDFHGLRFLAGGDEGQSMLYYENQFPSGAICPVTFMWRPLEADVRGTDAATGSTTFELRADWQATKRQLWLWIHPAAFAEAADAITTACRAVVDSSDDECVRLLACYWLEMDARFVYTYVCA